MATAEGIGPKDQTSILPDNFSLHVAYDVYEQEWRYLGKVTLATRNLLIGLGSTDSTVASAIRRSRLLTGLFIPITVIDTVEMGRRLVDDVTKETPDFAGAALHGANIALNSLEIVDFTSTFANGVLDLMNMDLINHPLLGTPLLIGMLGISSIIRISYIARASFFAYQLNSSSGDVKELRKFLAEMHAVKVGVAAAATNVNPAYSAFTEAAISPLVGEKLKELTAKLSSRTATAHQALSGAARLLGASVQEGIPEDCQKIVEEINGLLTRKIVTDVALVAFNALAIWATTVAGTAVSLLRCGIWTGRLLVTAYREYSGVYDLSYNVR